MANAEIIKVLDKALQNIDARKERSAWSKGVNVYAYELIEELKENAKGGWIKQADFETGAAIRAAMLNGARDWDQYSWGGCSLIYDGDIAERLCTPSELKKTRNGERKPNAREDWLDVQARALYQAANRATREIKKAFENA